VSTIIKVGKAGTDGRKITTRKSRQKRVGRKGKAAKGKTEKIGGKNRQEKELYVSFAVAVFFG
jgi:hypothetical protein